MRQPVLRFFAAPALLVALWLPAPPTVAGQEEAVVIDMSSLDEGRRFQAVRLGYTLSRAMVIRFGDEAPKSNSVWFQCELISPDDEILSRHASPHMPVKPGTKIDDRYAWPEKSPARFMEALGRETRAEFGAGGRRRSRGEVLFGANDRFTYVGESAEPGDATYSTRMAVYIIEEGQSAQKLAEKTLYYVLNAES